MASNNNNSASSPFAAGLAGLQELANRANSSSSQNQQSSSSSSYYQNNNRHHNNGHNDRGGAGRPHHRGGGGGGRRKRNREGGSARDGGSGGRDYRRPRHHQDESENHYHLTSRLRESNYQVNLFRPSLPPSEPQPHRPFHLALLVLSIDDLPYEHIWKAWATQTQQSSSSRNSSGRTLLVSLLCHAKFPDQVQSDFLRQRLLLKPPKYLKGRGNIILELQPPEYLTHRPEWGSIEITRAMIDLLREGLRIDGSSSTGKAGEAAYSTRRYLIEDHNDDNDDTRLETIPPVDKFVFISESCLPVTTLDETRLALFGDDDDDESPSQVEWKPDKAPPTTEKVAPPTAEDATTLEESTSPPPPPSTTAATTLSTSSVANHHHNLLNMSWVNARNLKTPGTPKNMYERDQFQGIGSLIPHCFRFKADQWLVLSRPHARVIVDLDRQLRPRDNPFWTLFSRINASDEMYMPTALAVLGILQDEEPAIPAKNGGQLPEVVAGAAVAAPSVVSTSATKTATTTTSTSTTLATSICQVKRAPVTYTDWSEGMRNPALFTKGVVDFQRVARIARDKGCLFARKFSPFLPVPGGTSTRVNNTSGIDNLSVEQWSKTLQGFQK